MKPDLHLSFVFQQENRTIGIKVLAGHWKLHLLFYTASLIVLNPSFDLFLGDYTSALGCAFLFLLFLKHLFYAIYGV